MGSQWTDKSAIMRDLSFAQGRWVPGGIDSAVASGKPPTHNITEETEEEYFKRWTTDGDISACPDFSLISRMLEMVHDEVPDTEDTQTGPIEIKKLNPVAKVFVPKFKKTEIKNTHQNIEANPITEKKKKPLRERNVAMASIIANATKLSQLSQDVKEEPIKLSKPEDFIKTSKKIDKEELFAVSSRKDSVNKVNSWLQSQDMSSMFKKKSTDSVKSLLPSDQSVESLPNQQHVPSPTPGQQYVPSSWAGEYYKKCMYRTHIRDMVQENVWARAEKLMKEIDLRKAEEQRKQEEEDAALVAALAEAEREALPDGAPDRGDSMASVLLPQHRHLLTGDCIVCKVLSKQPTEQATLLETEAPASAAAGAPEALTIKPEVEDAEDNQDNVFCELWSSFDDYLADGEAAEQNLTPLEESGSTEVLDILTSAS